MVNAHDLITMLRAHYGGTPSKPVPGYLVDELQAPDSARRADALWVPLGGTFRGQLIGHEIKVSRQDVMVELADPMKAEAWGRFCDRWWLVVPDIALLRDLDIPDAWGIMTPPKAGKRQMTVVRPAPLRKPDRDRTAYATVLARIYYRGDDAETRMRHLEAQRDREAQRYRDAHDQLVEANRLLRAAGADTSPHGRKVEERTRRIVDLIVAKWNIGGQSLSWDAADALGQTTDEEVVQLLTATAEARGVVQGLIRDAKRRADDLERAVASTDLADIRARLAAVAQVDP